MMKIERKKSGILIKNNRKRILIDPKRQPSRNDYDLVLVSHAHTDHTRGISQSMDSDIPLLLSKPTYEILHSKGTKIKNPILIKPGDTLTVNDIQIKALNSGHMLGSLQFVVSAPFDKKIAYTGDLNYEKSLILKGGETPKADILLLDCTYGNPHYILPKRDNLYPKIRAKLHDLLSNGCSRIVLHGYALGKAQELTRLASDVCENVGVTPRIMKYNRILEESSTVDLGNYEVDVKQSLQVKNMSKKKKDEKHISFTGWALQSNNSGISFPLSGHSGFLELLNFVGEVNPEKVITLYTFKQQFAGIIERKLGVVSKPI